MIDYTKYYIEAKRIKDIFDLMANKGINFLILKNTIEDNSIMLNKNTAISVGFIPEISREPFIFINTIPTSVFLEMFKPYLIPKGKFKYYVRQETVCKNAATELHKLSAGNLIWHKDHFDKWNGYFADIPEPDIEECGSTKIYGIEVSNKFFILYSNGKLYDIIISDKYNYETDKYSVLLNPYVEIVFDKEGRIKNLIPVKDWKYGKATFKADSFLSIDENGKITGPLAKNVNVNGFRIDEGIPVTVEPNGITYIESYKINDKEMFSILDKKMRIYL